MIELLVKVKCVWNVLGGKLKTEEERGESIPFSTT